MVAEFGIDHDIRVIHRAVLGELRVAPECQPPPRKKRGIAELQEVHLLMAGTEEVHQLEAEEMYSPCKLCRECWIAAFGKDQRRVLYTYCTVCDKYDWCIEPGLGFICQKCLRKTADELRAMK